MCSFTEGGIFGFEKGKWVIVNVGSRNKQGHIQDWVQIYEKNYRTV